MDTTKPKRKGYTINKVAAAVLAVGVVSAIGVYKFSDYKEKLRNYEIGQIERDLQQQGYRIIDKSDYEDVSRSCGENKGESILRWDGNNFLFKCDIPLATPTEPKTKPKREFAWPEPDNEVSTRNLGKLSLLKRG